MYELKYIYVIKGYVIMMQETRKEKIKKQVTKRQNVHTYWKKNSNSGLVHGFFYGCSFENLI